METMRLRSLQQPTRTQELLESLLLFLERPPRGADRVSDRTELPSVLQRLVIRGSKDGMAWAAWRQRFDIEFYGAELALDMARERGRPTLRVTVYDSDGKIRELANWAQVSQDAWQRQSQ